MKKSTRLLKIIAAAILAVCAAAALGSCQLPGTGTGGGDGDYNWNETTLLFQMTKSSNNNELSSGCERYYAGEGNKNETIDTLVDTRNAAVLKKTKTFVKYSYLDEGKSEYNWGKNIDTIVTQSLAGGSSAPDMYCNFAYDMSCAAIKGAFANLYSSKYDSNRNGKGENYFRFTEDDYDPSIDNYFDSTAGEGYFVGYMNSLSLSPNKKAYCLASDYCTDLVRSFLVVPVNIQILNQVKTDASVVDKNVNGSYDIEDFYRMVWEDEDWTYDMVAAISKNIAENTNDKNDTLGGTSHLGDKLGFAAGSGSGLTASGLLYTTDVSIIDRENLNFPGENEGLSVFSTKLAQLFENNKNYGVAVVSADEAKKLNSSYTDDLIGIREEFAKGNILFGGIIAVGSLEDSVYQNMKAKGGFGIAPVPLYRKASTANAYRTLVHNLARIVSISVTASDTFEMCTAFLNEQSMNSADVLNEYYNVNLAKVVSGDAGTWNVKMLVYIRNHVNDCFDKSFEDIIKDYDESGRDLAWHDYLKSLSYSAKELSTVYKAAVDNKNVSFNKVKAAWNRLTD